MSSAFSQNFYKLTNPGKYVGSKAPYYRSSWELTVFSMCDKNPNIVSWASEPMKLPYICPLTKKQTYYIPDLIIEYVDNDGKHHVELVEIKPRSQTYAESIGKNKYNETQYIKNQAKWQVAIAFCKSNNIRFRVINEDDIYVGMPKRKR